MNGFSQVASRVKGALFSEMGVGVGELEDGVGTQSFPV